MSVIVELARPKVNLTLAIRGRRADGYHELASLVAFAAAPADVVQLDVARQRGVSVGGPFGTAIEGVNLLDTVLDAVAPYLAARSPGHVTLDKLLPVAAGVGGGSADAAALLRALRRAHPDLDAAIDWPALALRLGADVPVCLAGRAAWMTGIGETLQEVAALPPLDAVLVNPRVAVPADKTARVFRALAAPRLADDAPAAPIPAIQPTARAQCGELARFGNDLTGAAMSVMPVIGDVLAAIEACEGCLLTRLSGAGPTAFGVFAEGGAAREATARIGRAQPHWWVAATVLGGAGIGD